VNIIVLLGDRVFVMQTVEMSRIHTTLEILLLQTTLTKLTKLLPPDAFAGL